MQANSAPPAGRRPRNSLTVEAILDAAERVATAGFDALTVRAVASELGSSPMALYRYFATKDELVDALLDRVLRRIQLPAETDHWIDDLRAFARSHKQLLLAHPWAIAPLISNPYPGPGVLPIGEAALGILQRAGLTGEDAVVAFTGIVALNYGWASFAVARANPPQSEDRGGLPSTPAAFPLTAGVADAMGRYGSDEHYERTLQHLLTGIESEARH